MSTVESIARPRRNGERRRAPTASISKESPAITGVVEMVIDRKSGSAGMPRPISYAVFCLKKKKVVVQALYDQVGQSWVYLLDVVVATSGVDKIRRWRLVTHHCVTAFF